MYSQPAVSLRRLYFCLGLFVGMLCPSVCLSPELLKKVMMSNLPDNFAARQFT